MSIPSVNTTLQQENYNNSMKGAVPAAVLTIRIICIPTWVGIIVFGVVGNILTIRVLRSKKLNNSSTSIYLIAVAFVDLVYLATSLSFRLIDYIYLFPNSLRHYNTVFCFFQPMLHFSSSYISVWLLVAVTIDRMIWVILPFRAKKICTRGKAITTIVCLCIFFISMDSHFLWTMRFNETSNGPIKCHSSGFELALYLTLSDLFLMGVCPFTVMIVANCLIILKLKQIRKIRESHARKPNSTQRSVEQQNPDVPLKKTGTERSCKVKDRNSSLTTMLLSINIFFMVSITPLLVYDIIFTILDLNTITNKNEDLYGPLFFAIEQFVYTLWYLNFSVHFLLYCMSGPKFRVEALKLFGVKQTYGIGECQTAGTEMQTYKQRRESARSPLNSP